MYEHRSESLASRRKFARRLAWHALAAAGLLAFALAVGVAGYMGFEKKAWDDALLNAAMLLGGMGPVGEIEHLSGKLFASAYALFCGLNLVSASAVLLAPLAHRMLHAFHLDDDDRPGGRTRR